MRTTAQLHLHPDAIRHNIATLRRHLQPHVLGQRLPRLWAVVKADAYGHGLSRMLSGFRDADGLAVSSLDEAYLCRTQGWSGPILYSACDDTVAALDDPVLSPLHVVLSTMEQVCALQSWRRSGDRHVWLRFAGALNHAGLKAADYTRTYRQLRGLLQDRKIAAIGHFQHYAHAEDTEHLHHERREFAALIDGLPGPVCSENSAAVLASPKFGAGTAWIRSGIVLYGANPLDTPHPVDLALRPAMTLRAPVYAVQHLRPGEGLGYASTFRAPHAMRIGLVRCGYADGYPRQRSSASPCRTAGRPATLIGRVSMDTLCVDLTLYPGIGTGSIVSLWGEYDITVQRVARATNTIAAQLFTGITRRVPRYYPGDPGYVAPQS